MRTRRTLLLGPCERGPSDPRPILFLRDAPQPSVLVMNVRGIQCEVLLHPRFVRLLLLLVDAWHKDAVVPEALRGFRTASDVALAFRRFLNGRGTVEPATVVDYVFQIRRLIRQALASAGIDVESEPVDLIEHRPCRGYRIGRHGIQIIEPAPADPDPDPD